MTKELQDLAWSVLPKEFKEEVKQLYKHENKVLAPIDGVTTLNEIFGLHNLTSDAEGEEMLTVPRKNVQELYAKAKDIYNLYANATCINSMESSAIDINTGKMKILDTLFGSKCLPDEPREDNFAKSAHEDNFTNTEPKPFKVGDKVTVRANAVSLYPRPGIITGQTDSPRQWTVLVEMADGDISYELSESDLEPYTEPKENVNLSQNITDCDKQFDNILKDSFREHNRLHIATEIAAAIIQSTDDITIDNKQVQKNLENVAKVAFLFADALISECEKGGSDGED